jgi:Skp family chaperone for outer membrane proteins
MIQEKQRVLERDYQDFQAEAQEAQQEAINKIVKKMLPVLEKLVLNNGYTAVFDVSSPQTPVIWASKEAIITEQLVNAYNIQTPAPTPPGSAGGAASPKP